MKVTQNWVSGCDKSVAEVAKLVADFALFCESVLTTYFGGRMREIGGRFLVTA